MTARITPAMVALGRTITEPSGLAHVISVAPTGSFSRTDPDASSTSLTMGPDPRFGMQAPVPAAYEQRPPSGVASSAFWMRLVKTSDRWNGSPHTGGTASESTRSRSSRGSGGSIRTSSSKA